MAEHELVVCPDCESLNIEDRSIRAPDGELAMLWTCDNKCGKEILVFDVAAEDTRLHPLQIGDFQR